VINNKCQSCAEALIRFLEHIGCNMMQYQSLISLDKLKVLPKSLKPSRISHIFHPHLEADELPLVVCGFCGPAKEVHHLAAEFGKKNDIWSIYDQSWLNLKWKANQCDASLNDTKRTKHSTNICLSCAGGRMKRTLKERTSLAIWDLVHGVPSCRENGAKKDDLKKHEKNRVHRGSS